MPPTVPASPSRRPPLTHFLCLPLTTPFSTPHLRAALEGFALDVAGNQHVGSGGTGAAGRSTSGPRDAVKHGITGNPGALGTIPPRAIRPPGAMHLTIGVMSLPTPEKIREACDFLERLDVKAMIAKIAATASTGTRSSEIKPALQDEPSLSANNNNHPDRSSGPSKANTHPIHITLTSLLPMHRPDRTSTLYASPSPQQPILLPFAQTLHDAFVEAGYLLPPPSIPANPGRKRGQVDGRRPRELKLHATIVNTIYAGKAEGDSPSFPTSPPRETDVQSGISNRHTGGRPEGAEPVGTEEAECSTPSAQVGGRKSEGEQDEANGGEPTDDTPEQRQGASNQRRGRRNRKILLDARDLIDRYRDHVWIPEFRLDRVAICEMGARKVYAGSGAEDENKKLARGKHSGTGQRVVDEMYVEVFAAALP